MNSPTVDTPMQRARLACETLINWHAFHTTNKKDAFAEQLGIALRVQDCLVDILEAAESIGVRFISFDEKDLIIMEDDSVKDPFSWPRAWDFAQKCGIYRGCGNGPQAQYKGEFLNQYFVDGWGIYDLRTRPFKRLSKRGYALFNYRSCEINKVFEGSDLRTYIERGILTPHYLKYLDEPEIVERRFGNQ